MSVPSKTVKKVRPTWISDLPYEIQSQIYAYLFPRESRILGKVSKDFYNNPELRRAYTEALEIASPQEIYDLNISPAQFRKYQPDFDWEEYFLSENVFVPFLEKYAPEEFSSEAIEAFRSYPPTAAFTVSFMKEHPELFEEVDSTKFVDETIKGASTREDYIYLLKYMNEYPLDYDIEYQHLMEGYFANGYQLQDLIDDFNSLDVFYDLNNLLEAVEKYQIFPDPEYFNNPSGVKFLLHGLGGRKTREKLERWLGILPASLANKIFVKTR